MKCSFDILGIGTIAVDDIVLVDHYPAADEKVSIKGRSRSYGGLVGSALATAGKLGKRCAYAGVLGHDQLSDAMREALVGVGIDVSQIITREEAKPIHSIIVTDTTCHTRNIFFDATNYQVLPADMVSEELISS
ncbi:MAG: PfkB family carbohydrate kinase, partial [Candidatus Latescibacteria bacterium]|nr:PfkB family carbohydrate kinase [Candidatus Latescibacterota bacterium]